MTKRCPHCNIDNPGSLHACPFEKANLLKILFFLKENVETKSRFEKNLNPFPSSLDFDAFLRENNIMRLQSIKIRYFDDDLSLEEWLSELIGVGLSQGLLNEDDFPPHLLFVWDAWCFLDKANYKKAYELAIAYEDGDELFDEAKPLPEGAIPFSLNLA